MAQNDNRTVKRQARADRRAQQAALEQAQAAQAAKERRQQTIIGAAVVAVIVVIIAVICIVVYTNVAKQNAVKNTSETQAYQQVQQVKTKPSRANDKGGILISKNGYGKRVAGAPTVAVYMDPLCPGCGALNQQLDPTLKKLMDSGQINMELYPLSFLDSGSTDKYSSRVSNSINYIADNDNNPDHLFSYITNIYASNFQPQEGSNYKSVSDNQLKQQAIKAGVSATVAGNAFNGEFQNWLDALNIYTPKRPELWNVAGQLKGQFTTPTVTLNGTAMNMTQASQLSLSYSRAVLTSIGLRADQVGKAGALPSIGASGKPIDLSKATSAN